MPRRFRWGLAAGLLVFSLLLAGLFVVYKANIDIPFFGYSGPSEGIWSIGIYDLEIGDRTLTAIARQNNPVLTASDVNDMPTRFVADPFLLREEGQFLLFFEILGADHGVIGLATSPDGDAWTYRGVVLKEPFHLSYPNVFKWRGDYYLVPESLAANNVRLYKASRFPDAWQLVKPIIEDRALVDSTIFVHQDTLWLFSSSPDNQNLYLFYADRPEGPWHEHPESPIVRNNSRDARLAGNILDTGKRIIRFAQDSQAYGEQYGKAVRGFEITTLTRDAYNEHPLEGNPILAGSGKGWNSEGMHQLSPVPLKNGRWIAAVDGKRRSGQHIFCFGKNIFRIP